MELRSLKLTKRRLELLEGMNIHTVEDLIRWYPLRYEMVDVIPFSRWSNGDAVCFEGLICSAASVLRLSNNRSMTKVRVLAWEQELELTLFNRPWPSQFQMQQTITVFGTYNGNGKVTVSRYNFRPLSEQKGMMPVYSVSARLKQSDMQAVMKEALKHVEIMQERVPERYREKYRLLPIQQAYRLIHQPGDEKQLHAAIRTLKYEEFLSFQCVMQSMQHHTETKEKKVFDRIELLKKENELPYSLTADQKQALEDILADMASDTVMFRLVQGDVGCGKTAVAMLAMEACILSHQQAALLAPTEILARQHAAGLEKLHIPARLYVSSLPAKEKREILAGLADGSIQAVVGTHALFQESVTFARLGLVIADEQQRFGVRQRRSLLEKGNRADFLMMSATPIPRTYAHFLYGDIALSSIKTLPPGRSPVKTKFIPGSSMGPILKRVLKGIKEEGRQVYVVCAMIEENPETSMKAVTAIYEGMKKTIGHLVKISLLHGKMKPAEKEQVMEDFKEGHSDILVSTTVVEVGVDVPNATIMVIYDAHRYGLSTLHQLRGRAARGKLPGECYLLSNTKDSSAIERLKKMEELLDGFSISAYDLSIRGPGDVLGVRQSGLPSFVLGDFEKDPAIMDTACRDAKEIVERGEDTAMLEYVKAAMENASYFD